MEIDLTPMLKVKNQSNKQKTTNNIAKMRWGKEMSLTPKK